MKKSRIILPAAALLALSSAAAVTGTVAWFTANRIRNIDFTGVTAVNPEQGLNMSTAKSLVNCSRSVVDGVETIAHSQLRDASYDVADEGLYGSILDADSGQVVGYAAKTMNVADTKKYGGQNVYFATQFAVDFTITRVESGYAQSLMFDLDSSTISAKGDETEHKSVGNALRVAIKTSTRAIVWAPYTRETTVKNVSGALAAWNGTGTLDTYLATKQENTANVLKGTTFATALPDDSAGAVATSSVTGHAGYLGTLTTTALTVTITTWFEGLDQDCINEAQDLAQAFTASLQFTMRKSA